MLICNRCGELKREEDIRSFSECHGHTSLGQRLEEKCYDYDCPCGGEFVEAKECKVCGEWFDNTDLEGVCEGCLEKYETVGDALSYGEFDMQSVDINGFVVSVIPKEQINAILTKWVEENVVDNSKVVTKYCEQDLLAFSDYVRDKAGKNG